MRAGAPALRWTTKNTPRHIGLGTGFMDPMGRAIACPFRADHPLQAHASGARRTPAGRARADSRVAGRIGALRPAPALRQRGTRDHAASSACRCHRSDTIAATTASAIKPPDDADGRRRVPVECSSDTTSRDWRTCRGTCRIERRRRETPPRNGRIRMFQVTRSAAASRRRTR